MYLEITLFFVFWFHIDYFHSSFNYEVPGREDVQAAGTVKMLLMMIIMMMMMMMIMMMMMTGGLVLIDTLATVCLICGVNKDYSGRHMDLK